MVPTLIIVIVIFILILIKSAEQVVVALRRLSANTGTNTFLLSSILLALATSFPELFVGITSALGDTPNLALGVVVGSNIANIALVGGISAIVMGRINIKGDYIANDVLYALVAGFLPLLLVMDGSLSRVDGLILLSVYMAYATSFFKKRYLEIGKEQKEENVVFRFMKEFNHVAQKRKREFGRLFVAIAVMLLSADVIVRMASDLAENSGLPLFVVGLLVLSVGTSLPELAFSLKSLGDREPSMFFGNLLGSTIANSTLVIGITTIISPIQIQAFNQYLFATIAFLIIFILLWRFVKTKHRLDRWEAAVLVFVYFLFLVGELI